MNRLDVLIILLSVSGAFAGFRLGLARRIFGWAGLWVGVVLAALLLPHVMPTPQSRTPGTFVASAAVMIGLALSGHIGGSMIGSRVHRTIVTQRARTLDSSLGAAAGVLGVILLAWVVLPAMSNVAGWPAEEVRSSAAAKAIDATLGQPPSVLDGLSKSLGPNPFPRVFSDLGDDRTRVEAPPQSPVSADVLNAVAPSVVKISGTVCDHTQTGSGFAAEADTVVTNAHVVAGLSRVTVSTRTGSETSGEVVAFDPDRDLAVVHLRSATLTPLQIGDAEADDTGVVLGYPGGGDFTVSPFRIAQRVDAQGRDIYDHSAVMRKILVMGADIAPGDSGGPLIDPGGKVAGVAFAIAPDRPNVAYGIRTEEVRHILAVDRTAGVSTGRCLE